jgi:hypothetical protein
MVGKRQITGASDNSKNNNREETTMNFGYFYVSGVTSDEIDNSDLNHKKNCTSVAPFARLLESRMRNRSTSTETTETTIDMAHKRRNALLARRNLLAGMGKPVAWDSSLEVQAPLLTIMALLQLCNEYEQSSDATSTSTSTPGEENETEGPCWKTVRAEGENSQLFHSPPHIEWTYGDFWGHHNTVLICGKTVISRRKLSTSDINDGSNRSTFLQDVYRTLYSERSKWDPLCLSVKVLEKKNEDDNAATVDDEDTVFWDVAEYEMRASNAHAMFCLLRAGSYIGEDGGVLATRLDEHSNSYIVSNTNKSKNIIPARGVLASRSVCHERSSANTYILPSGFLLKSCGCSDKNDNENEHEYLEITYVSEVRIVEQETHKERKHVCTKNNASCLHLLVVAWFPMCRSNFSFSSCSFAFCHCDGREQHDLNGIRHSGAFGTNQVSDDYIVCFLASSLSVVLANLAAMEHCAAY